jgi:hypothetical protein
VFCPCFCEYVKPENRAQFTAGVIQRFGLELTGVAVFRLPGLENPVGPFFTRAEHSRTGEIKSREAELCSAVMGISSATTGDMHMYLRR